MFFCSGDTLLNTLVSQMDEFWTSPRRRLFCSLLEVFHLTKRSYFCYCRTVLPTVLHWFFRPSMESISDKEF